MDISWNRIKDIISKAKDLRYLALANILGKAIAGVFWFYIAAILGAENYGQISYFVAIGSMAASFALVGTTNTLIVYVAKKVPIQPAIYFITLILGTIASVIVVLVYDSYEAGLFVIGYVIFNLAISDLLGRKFYKRYSKFFVLQKVLFVVCALGLYYVLDIPGIILGFAISFLIFTPIIISGFREHPLNFSVLKKRFGFMMNSYALSIERIFSGQIDKIIIAPMFGFAILGNFSLAIQAFSVMLLIPNIVYQYTLSQDASGNPSIIIKKLSVIFSCIIAILGYVLSPIVIPWIFPEFVDSIQILQIIGFAIIPYSFNMSYTSKFLGGERARIILIGQAVSVSTYVVGLFVFGDIFGINGVALALLVSGIMQFIFYFITNRYFLDSKIFKPSKDSYF